MFPQRSSSRVIGLIDVPQAVEAELRQLLFTDAPHLSVTRSFSLPTPTPLHRPIEVEVLIAHDLEGSGKVLHLLCQRHLPGWLRDIPVLVIVGQTRPQQLQRLLDFGAASVIIYPHGKSRLLDEIERLLEPQPLKRRHSDYPFPSAVRMHKALGQPAAGESHLAVRS